MIASNAAKIAAELNRLRGGTLSGARIHIREDGTVGSQPFDDFDRPPVDADQRMITIPWANDPRLTVADVLAVFADDEFVADGEFSA